MFICTACHSSSTCRAEIHMTISRERCSGCGHVTGCFSCNATISVKSGTENGRKFFISMYKNTKQISYGTGQE
jgi:hypothetical protein